VQRGDKQLDLTLTLPKGWRERDEISWRVSSWGMRRMFIGGLLLDILDDEERKHDEQIWEHVKTLRCRLAMLN